MVDYCIPLLGYYDGPATEKSVQDYILGYFFPVLEQGREVIYYQTEIESDFSYEMILAMEAADENYVDTVTGQVVGDIDIEELEADDGMLEQTGQDEIEGSSDVSVTALTGKTKKAVTYSREKLADFDYLIQNFYRVDKTTTINSQQLNATEMLEKDMTLTHDAKSPQILIYHTHSQEGYVDSVAGDVSTTVVGVGDYLTKLLQEQYGLNVIHHTGQYDVETRDDAYALAGPAVEKILAENPSIEVVIDLHRDGVGEDTRLVTNIDGVDMAKIMFVNGLSRTTSVGEIGYLYNPNLADNLAFSFQTQLATSEYYPGLSRGVYLKGYRYNLHYCPKSLLVEVGAQTNTVQEAMNAMVPLADILNKVVTGHNGT
ncbi:MAG: stage II sporulation protein P [Roseburia sp.]|nr:stage II sporulation protein P [Roseburia sp.]